MTMKNIPIAIAFTTITASQFVLGICVIIRAIGKGGMVRFFDQRDDSYSQRPLAPSGLRMYRSNGLTTTPRRLPRVYVLPTMANGGCVHQHFPLLWSAYIILSSDRETLILLVTYTHQISSLSRCSFSWRKNQGRQFSTSG